MARHFRGSGHVLRFIEYMDVGASNGWRMDEVLPSARVLQRLQAEWPLVPLQPTVEGETAERWAYADGAGEIGLISSVTQAFCRDCNRARLSTEGKLFLCLFATQGHDLTSVAPSDPWDTAWPEPLEAYRDAGGESVRRTFDDTVWRYDCMEGSLATRSAAWSRCRAASLRRPRS